MFIKTALAFALILFTTNTMMAGSSGRAKKKDADYLYGKCVITEFHEEKDTIFAQAMGYRIGEKECEEKARLECSLLTLRVEYIWENSPKQTIECKNKIQSPPQ